MNARCVKCNCLFKKKYLKQRFCSITCSNRHNLNNKIAFKKPFKYSNELAELFGILLGDGSVEKYYIKIYLNMIADKGYAQNVTKLIKIALPGVKSTVHTRKNRGTEEVQISSVEVCNYFRLVGFNPKNRRVPDWITKNKSFTEKAIRGLFDTEGSVGIKRFKGKGELYTYRQLTFTNKNKSISEFVRKSLLVLGFSPTKSNKFNLYISNKNDIQKYFTIIGTSNPKLEKKMKMT